jgi:lactate dehydrogenase-like 2-hydroxyacid dehydrogenase
MGQRRNQYLSPNDLQKLIVSVSCSLGDVQRSIEALKSGDMKKIRQEMLQAYSRAQYNWEQLNKLNISSVTPKEWKALTDASFVRTNDPYVQFSRVKGAINTIIEFINYDRLENKWYGKVIHYRGHGFETIDAEYITKQFVKVQDAIAALSDKEQYVKLGIPEFTLGKRL